MSESIYLTLLIAIPLFNYLVDYIKDTTVDLLYSYTPWDQK
jgi:hypothetical protein